MSPEFSPTLDDAIRALDRVIHAGRTPHPDLLLACRFLDLLDEVRNVPPVVQLNREQSELMEISYANGVRTADESGHVLVVSLPAFLGLMRPILQPTIKGRLSAWFARLFPPNPCNQNCAQGDKCPSRSDMADAYHGAREDAAIWKKRALEAEAKLRLQQLDQVFAKAAPDSLAQAMRERQARAATNGGKHAG